MLYSNYRKDNDDMEESYISRTSGIKGRDKFGYALGDFGSCLLFGLVQSILQKYYTDVMQLSVVSIMIMMIIARIWDAINDPIWGGIIDRAPLHEDGRYRHWIKVFAVPVAVSAVLMFVKIPGLSQSGYLVYAYFTYILFGMLYTCINIPYGSLAQVITSDDKERSSLSVFRSVGSTFGAMPAMVLISFCYVTVNGERHMSAGKTLAGSIIIAVFAVAAFFLTYRFTRERVATKPAPKSERRKTFNTILQLFKSRPYVAVCIASMLFLAAQMFAQAYNSYLFDYYFESPGLTMLPTVCQYLPVAVIMFFAGRMGSRYGRREVCSYGILFAGICYLLLFVFGAKNVWAFLAVCLASGIGSAFMFLLLWSLATDAIDYNAVRFGINDDATSYACYTFMRKLGQTIEAVLVNASLIRIGYTDNVLNTANINAGTLKRMYSDSVLIPAVLFILVFVFLRFVYPLGKKEIEQLQAEKEEMYRRAAEG